MVQNVLVGVAIVLALAYLSVLAVRRYRARKRMDAACSGCSLVQSATESESSPD